MAQVPERLKRDIESLAIAALDARTAPPFVPGETVVPVTAPVYGHQELVNAITAVLEFQPAAGHWATKLEVMLAKWFGVRAARLTNSGSSANLLALAALMRVPVNQRRVYRGDEVITVAAAFPTTVAPIVQHGLIPVFVDVEWDTANIDVQRLEDALSPQTRVVMLAHTLGNPFNVAAVKAFCNKHDLWLIEDCCDAVGATWEGQKVGSFGDLATLSFYPAHHMTMGEGGAVLIPEGRATSDLRHIVTSLRDWGRDCWCAPGRDNTCGKRFAVPPEVRRSLPADWDHKYTYSHLGYNMRVTDMQAAIGVAQMARLDSGIQARRANWYAYLNAFAHPAPLDFFNLPTRESTASPSPFGFLISTCARTPFTREQIVRHLEAKKIQTRPLFAGNLLRHPAMRGVLHRSIGNLPNTDYLMRNAFWIGVHPGITPEMRAYVIDTINTFTQGAHR